MTDNANTTAAQPLDLDKQRADFEAEAAKRGMNIERAKKFPELYKYEHAAQMWDFWQIAQARAAQPAGKSAIDRVSEILSSLPADLLDRPADLDKERELFDSLYDADEFRSEYDKYGPAEAAFTVFQYARAARRAAPATTDMPVQAGEAVELPPLPDGDEYSATRMLANGELAPRFTAATLREFGHACYAVGRASLAPVSVQQGEDWESLYKRERAIIHETLMPRLRAAEAALAATQQEGE